VLGSSTLRKVLHENWHILAVLSVFTVAKLPSLTLPFWWDEAGAYIPPSLSVAKEGLWVAFPGLHAKGLLHSHPPILYLLHGALYQLFGDLIAPHRIVALGFAVIGLWFTH
jgi:hypothetical protein